MAYPQKWGALTFPLWGNGAGFCTTASILSAALVCFVSINHLRKSVMLQVIQSPLNHLYDLYVLHKWYTLVEGIYVCQKVEV